MPWAGPRVEAEEQRDATILLLRSNLDGVLSMYQALLQGLEVE